MEEYRDLVEDDFFNDWMSDNRLVCEEEFLETIPREDQPLDDELSDFLDSDDFNEFCRNKMNEALSK